MNLTWLERLMASKGITYHALRKEHHVSWGTLQAWAAGGTARAFVVRKLAAALSVEVPWLVRNAGIKMADERKRVAKMLRRKV
ncbi:MAG: hypothetical protein ACRDZ4_17715 [Egibacteraceae bacterium]